MSNMKKNELCTIVFGGHSPIGKEITIELARIGNVKHFTRKLDLSLLSWKESLSSKESVDLVEFDLGDDFQKLEHWLTSNVEQFSEINLVFSQRYRGLFNPINQYTVEVLRPFQVCNTFLSQLQDRLRTIIFVSSPAASKILADQDYFYHANKSAIETLVRFLAVHETRSGLRTFAINPGSFVLKDRNRNYYAENPYLLDRIRESIPSGKMTTCEDIANFSRFLIENAPAQMSGSIFNLDGSLSNRDIAGFISE